MIVNYTPHSIVIQTDSGRSEFLADPNRLARVTISDCPTDPVPDGPEGELRFPAVSQVTGKITGLPEPNGVDFFIVSRMVFDATDRQDVIAPDTGPTAIRDENGRIRAVTRFVRR